jgi:hypothetical protein
MIVPNEIIEKTNTEKGITDVLELIKLKKEKRTYLTFSCGFSESDSSKSNFALQVGQ